jgi:hypothetical protein
MKRGANVDLHIERIVVEGWSFNRAQMRTFERGLQRELSALLGARGVPARGYAQAAVSAPIGAGAHDAASLAREVARGIYDCLNLEL